MVFESISNNKVHLLLKLIKNFILFFLIIFVILSVIIPVFNEKKNLQFLFPKLLKFLKQHFKSFEIIIIDSFSKDGSYELAKLYTPNVWRCEKGKGIALKKGIEKAKGDVLVFLDADLSHRIEEIKNFMKYIKYFDIVKGSRFLKGGGSEDLTYLRKLLNFLVVKIVNFLLGSNFTDICYGYFCVKKEKLSRLNLVSDGFEIETEIFIKAWKKGYKIKEIPSFEEKRKYGKGKLRIMRDGLRILKVIIKNC